MIFNGKGSPFRAASFFWGLFFYSLGVVGRALGVAESKWATFAKLPNLLNPHFIKLITPASIPRRYNLMAKLDTLRQKSITSLRILVRYYRSPRFYATIRMKNLLNHSFDGRMPIKGGISMRFDWDENKNKANLKKHGIAFEDVLDVFYDPFRIDLYDEDNSGDEDRYAVIGYVHDILYVVYTMRNDNEVYRIISARIAEGWEVQEYLNGRG